MQSINVIPGIPKTISARAVQGFTDLESPLTKSNVAIAGVTRDSVGSALSYCTVKLFLTGSDLFQYVALSDVNGNYIFSVPAGIQFYAVSYLAGAPDVMGTTVNTLTGS